MDSGSDELTVVLVTGADDEGLVAVAQALERIDASLDIVRYDPSDLLSTAVTPAMVVFDESLVTDRDFAFLEQVRESWPETVLVYSPAEQVAPEHLSHVLASGVDGYVPATDRTASLKRYVDRLSRSRGRSQSTLSTATAVDGFEAITAIPETFVWLLDPTGAIVWWDDSVPSAFTAPSSGTPFHQWSLWPATAQQSLKSATEAALDGSTSERQVTVPAVEGEDSRSLSVTITPRPDGGCVVLGRDVTEMMTTIRELRQSEELHRVTLAHMTDTVLLTDEEGRFTYVCPNVHFIFGYTAEEIHDLGTIDALLGPDCYDEDALEETGVLTNVECRATDRDGVEHDLLVNIREVSIQDGRTLFSCRDVTARKDRERALTALHETARALLYAETKHEIATRVVDDAAGALGLSGVALYLFDATENVLRPTARTDAFETFGEPPSPTWPGEDDIVATSFLRDEPRVFPTLERWDSTVGGLRSAVVIPLGDHGVFLAGSPDENALDGVTKEVADLLAATAEAALDRVERESTVRERDQALQAQNSRLTAVNQLNAIIREIGQELVGAETRAEIEEAVCSRLTTDDRFAFAWIGSRSHQTATLEPRAWSGSGQGYLDALEPTLESETGDREPTVETLETGESVGIENVAANLRGGTWRSLALSRGFQSVLSVPIAYDEFGYGALSVYATQRDGFDEMVQAVLAELGEMIASAIGSVERTQALLGGHGTELTYASGDGETVLERLASEHTCTLELEGGLQRLGTGVLAFFTLEGAAADVVVEHAQRLVGVDDAQVVSGAEGGGLVRIVLSEPFLPSRLAEHGAIVTTLAVGHSGTTLTIEVPTSVDPASIDGVVRSTYPDADLRSRRDLGPTPTTGYRFEQTVLDALTERQLEVVRTAYHAGYFERPREQTGAEVAASLDISPTAFSNHLRAVQSALFGVLFEELHVGVQ